MRLLRAFGIGRGLRRVILRTRGPNPYIRAAAVEQSYVDDVLTPHARQLADDLTAQLRRDGQLYGEARIEVGWSDALQAPTHERIPPEQWQRWPAAPLTPEQSDRLDQGWGPSACE